MNWYDLDFPSDSPKTSKPATPPASSPSPGLQGAASRAEESKQRHDELMARREADLQRQHEEKLEKITQELHAQAATILADTFSAREIDPSSAEPPNEWLTRMPSEEAVKKFRVAQAGWLSQKESPSFVATARAFAIGVMKSEAAKKGGSRSLNIQYINMTAPEEEYEEIVVEAERK